MGVYPDKLNGTDLNRNPYRFLKFRNSFSWQLLTYERPQFYDLHFLLSFQEEQI